MIMRIFNCAHPWEGEVTRYSASSRDSSLPALTVAEVTRVVLAGADALGASQRGHVQHDVTAEVLGSVGHTISQHQPALSISVVDLNSLATRMCSLLENISSSCNYFSPVHGVHIIRSGGQGSNTVLRQTQDTVQRIFEPILDCNIECSHHSCCSSTVSLHPRHSSLALQYFIH